ncbi:MAG: hypothetical protein KDC07_06870 [Chitinophagaceae bacterium]|nr:hypothetical protein [Chitinophagaceae bacterium]MCB9047025.1 hypothetical protein [Chitinophagales bacterium]
MKLSFKNIALIAGAALLLTSCQKKESTVLKTSNEVHFMFNNYFGNEELALNSGNYTTSQNEQVTINTFNYWITNIRFIKSDGSEYAEEESYHLVRGNKSATHHFHVEDIPAATYTGIKFMIGVDVPRNTSGAQTGELDPAVNGDMFWTWNTGYIQAKLEGTSPQSNETDNAFTYHVGGVAAGMETPREVTLTFGADLVVGEQAGSIDVMADAAKWFGPGNPVKIAMTPTMTMPGAMAVKMADNYAKMFSIMSVGNE